MFWKKTLSFKVTFRFKLLKNILTNHTPLTFSGMQAWSSSRSFRQISRCSSPAPAMICSPDSSMMHCTMGSDLARRFRPSTSLGKSAGFLASTATRTTGLTLNFITLMLWACRQSANIKQALFCLLVEFLKLLNRFQETWWKVVSPCGNL